MSVRNSWRRGRGWSPALQHDGGDTDGPNWKYFIPWADRLLEHKSSVPATN